MSLVCLIVRQVCVVRPMEKVRIREGFVRKSIKVS